MKSAPQISHAVILAGGRGTRFWPRSRTRTPKQLLNIVGEKTMLVQTVERLLPIFPASRIWVVTNDEQVAAVRKQLPRIPKAHILAEPIGRNTAAAIGLAAVHIARETPGALMAVLPADHYIATTKMYHRCVRAALDVAARGPNLVMLGIPPTHPETGYGYVERAAAASPTRGCEVFSVKRFTEKPELKLARRYVASRRYFWNAGMFFWRVSTFMECLENDLPSTHAALRELGKLIGSRLYGKALHRIYPRLENISVDFAVMEPATRAKKDASCIGPEVFVLPANIGWSDIGSWAAVYELLAKKKDENVSAGVHVALDAVGNFLWSPHKFIAAIGVKDLVLVETAHAILICPRNRAQDVGKVVKWLELEKLNNLL
ncbi:MAG: mannose-1-phosphate guanylyltransferase [Acidobacteria bacterium]|nr:mannose-1-phosphate guanylyltransferase [Acidobacteriota bacterium]